MAEEDDVRQRIDRMHKRVQQQTYYELLEIDREEIEEESVMKKFRLKAKEWHADRFSGYDLDETYRQKLQEIFSALNTAQQVLSDRDKRAEYDFKLQAGDQDIGSIINAEDAFRRGKNMLKTGSYKGAHEQFQTAYDLNPDEDEYRAHLLYTEYVQISKDEQGRPVERSRASEIYNELEEVSEERPDDDAVLTFQGVVAMGLGKTKKAKSLFDRALQHNRNNVVAKRQRRLIRMRQKRDEKKGFFEKLLDKFRA